MRPIVEVSPILERVKAFPSRGRGTALAVDEVTCEPAPLRGASTHSIKKRPAMESSLPIDGRFY